MVLKRERSSSRCGKQNTESDGTESLRYTQLSFSYPILPYCCAKISLKFFHLSLSSAVSTTKITKHQDSPASAFSADPEITVC